MEQLRGESAAFPSQTPWLGAVKFRRALPWLSRHPARRTARFWARANFGREGSPHAVLALAPVNWIAYLDPRFDGCAGARLAPESRWEGGVPGLALALVASESEVSACSCSQWPTQTCNGIDKAEMRRCQRRMHAQGRGRSSLSLAMASLLLATWVEAAVPMRRTASLYVALPLKSFLTTLSELNTARAGLCGSGGNQELESPPPCVGGRRARSV